MDTCTKIVELSHEVMYSLPSESHAEMGQEVLEERLQGAVQVPAVPPYRLATLIAESIPKVRYACIHHCCVRTLAMGLEIGTARRLVGARQSYSNSHRRCRGKNRSSKISSKVEKQQS